jgi:hypothetical protein
MQLTTTSNQGFAPVTLDEAMRFSEMLAKSQMVPKAYQGKPEDVLVAVQWGRELGLAPLQALQNIACINGKPSVYGDAAMALVQASPVCENIEEYFEGEGSPNPVAICVARRKGRTPVTVKFSVEDAKRAGLWGKAGPWQAYPKRMMQMRARGFALRDAFPDVLKGLVTVEEAQDYPSQGEKDITPPRPSNPLDALAPPATKTPVEELQIPPESLDQPPEEIAEPVEPSEAIETTVAWDLQIPGGDPRPCENADSWVASYLELVGKVAKAGKASAQARLDGLQKLRNSNAEPLKKLSVEQRMELTAALAKFVTPLKEMAAAEKN